MYSNPGNKTLVTVLAVGVSVALTRIASAEPIIPVAQNRSVSNEQVNAPQCTSDFLFDEDVAAGFEPFDAFVETMHGCDSGFASASAGQQSQIGPASMAGAGSATAEGIGPVPGVIHAFGISFFEVTFDVSSVSDFNLTGVITAGAAPDPSVGALADIKLTGPGGLLIVEYSVQPAPGGETNSQVIDEGVALGPGQYVLQAKAGTFMKNEVPPCRSADASFDFTFVASTFGVVPTVSQWGMFVMALLILTAGTASLRRRFATTN